MFQEILKFWFDEIESSQWWKKDEAFDDLIRTRFSDIHGQAARCELFDWRKTPEGRLAEIIILDQFSRNMFRGLPESFAFDSQALILAQEAVANGTDEKLSSTKKSFLYMPYMHSESLKIHDVAMELFNKEELKGSLEFEIKHREIIERFGRYPHRNQILGRESTTAEEIEFLSQPGSSF